MKTLQDSVQADYGRDDSLNDFEAGTRRALWHLSCPTRASARVEIELLREDRRCRGGCRRAESREDIIPTRHQLAILASKSYAAGMSDEITNEQAAATWPGPGRPAREYTVMPGGCRPI